MARHRSLLSWYWRAKTAFSIHSPQIFHFCEEVLDDSRWYYAFETIEAAHQEFGKESLTSRDSQQGKGNSEIILNPIRSLFSYFRKSHQEKKGQGLFRMCKWWQPDRIIAFGCSDGRSSAYLSAGRSSASTFTIASDKDKLEEARVLWDTLGITNIIPVYTSNQKPWSRLLEQEKKRTLIYIGGDYQVGEVLFRLEEISLQIPKPYLVILDILSDSKSLETEWSSFAQDKGGAWLDLYNNYLWIADNAFLQPLSLTLISRKFKPFRLGWI